MIYNSHPWQKIIRFLFLIRIVSSNTTCLAEMITGCFSPEDWIEELRD